MCGSGEAARQGNKGSMGEAHDEKASSARVGDTHSAIVASPLGHVAIVHVGRRALLSLLGLCGEGVVIGRPLDKIEIDHRSALSPRNNPMSGGGRRTERSLLLPFFDFDAPTAPSKLAG